MIQISQEELRVRLRLAHEFPFYAEHCLKLSTPEGLVPFILNPIQIMIDEMITKEYERRGRFRGIYLKARQVGCSTYIVGRGYQRVSHREGYRGFIFTHSGEATNQLFQMTKNFHENCPIDVKPQSNKSNAREFLFNNLKSGYKIGTAGSKGVGRSQTIHYLHASEAGFWENAHQHATSLFPTVPDKDDTEIHIESTANGAANWFCQQWKMAESKESDFTPMFFPWFVHPDYQLPIPADFEPTEEEERLVKIYDLNYFQIYWRRLKIASLTSHIENGEVRFKQEYPSNPQEAFISSGDSFIRPEDVQYARKEKNAIASGHIIIGIDPARSENGDRTVILIRQGRVVQNYICFRTYDTMHIVGKAKEIIEKNKAKRVFIDVGGVGAGVVDRLREMFGSELIKQVNFGGEPFNKERFVNKRAEMWASAADWLREYPVSIPDKDDIASDLLAPQIQPPDSLNRVRLESKESIRKRGMPSPDIADALALTFAFPISEYHDRPIEYPNYRIV